MKTNRLKRLGMVLAVLFIGTILATNSSFGQKKPLTITLASTSVYPSDTYFVGHTFKEALEVVSKELKVNFQPASQLGSAKEQIDGVLTGSIQMMYEDMALFESLVPKLEVFSMPFLIKNTEHLNKAFKSRVGKELGEDFRKKGLRLIGVAGGSPRYLTSNKPIRTPSDLKGFKLRVPNVTSWIDLWKTLGASPTPMAFSEVYGSLAVKTIEGQENPAVTIIAAKLFEVQKYIILTGHIHGNSTMVANDKWFSSLPQDSQNIILGAADLACDYASKLSVLREKEVLKLLEKSGLEIIKPDLRPWEAAVKEMHKKYTTFSPALYEAIEEIGKK